GVEDVQHDHGREDELQVGIGHDEAHIGHHLTPEIGVEADAKDQDPEQRTRHAADQLALVLYRAFDFAPPDRMYAAGNAPGVLETARRGTARSLCHDSLLAHPRPPRPPALPRP